MYGATDDGSTSESFVVEQTQLQSSSHLAKRRPSAQIDFDDAATHIQWKVYLFTFCAALNSAALGYDFAINTYAGPLLWQDLQLSTAQLEFFMGSLSFAAVLGCALATTIADAYGRLFSFIVANAAVISGLAIVCLVSRYDLLLVGRTLMGIGIGISLVMGPIYIAEIAPPLHRGWFVSWHESAINVGCIIAFACGLGFSNLEDNVSWRLMFAAGGVLPMLVLFSVATIMIESPRWLVRKGLTDKAKDAIGIIFGENADSIAIMKEISVSVHEEIEHDRQTSWSSFVCPSGPLRYMLVVGVFTCISQQVVGIEPVMIYMQMILKSTGKISDFTLNSLPLIVGIVKLLLVPMAGRLMDSHGRRPMMIFSFVGMAVTSCFLAVLFHSKSDSLMLLMNVLIMYVAFFSMGAGPGAWLITPELFSNTVRVKGMSIATLCNRIVAAVEVTVFLSVSHNFGMYTVFVFFGTTSILYALFFWTCLVETQSMTLEQVAHKIRESSGSILNDASASGSA